MIDFKEHRTDLYNRIRLHRSNIRLLLDFATGFKVHKKFKYSRMNDWRLISSLKNLHTQSRELEKEYKLLNKLIKKTEKGKSL